MPESVGACCAFRLSADGAREGVLLCAGDCFMFVSARPPAAEGGAAADDGLAGRLTYEASYGRVSASGDEPAWRITHSTVPGRAGAALLPPSVAAGADALESETARGAAGALASLGAFPPPGGWSAARAWPLAALPEIDLAALDARRGDTGRDIRGGSAEKCWEAGLARRRDVPTDHQCRSK